MEKENDCLELLTILKEKTTNDQYIRLLDTFTPRTLLELALILKLKQKPTDLVLPKSDKTCRLLCDIIFYVEWKTTPFVIECKNRSPKQWQELRELAIKKCCELRWLKGEWPQTGYQVEYFLELFKYIKGVYETS